VSDGERKTTQLGAIVSNFPCDYESQRCSPNGTRFIVPTGKCFGNNLMNPASGGRCPQGTKYSPKRGACFLLSCPPNQYSRAEKCHWCPPMTRPHHNGTFSGCVMSMPLDGIEVYRGVGSSKNYRCLPPNSPIGFIDDWDYLRCPTKEYRATAYLARSICLPRDMASRQTLGCKSRCWK